MNTDDYLQIGALELARNIQKRDVGWIDRVDVRNNTLHVVPDGNADIERIDVEAHVDEWVGSAPFTFSERWYDRSSGERHIIVAPYWPTGGQCSAEQLEQYDSYIAHMEKKHD